jgi:Rieske Fe-S protein
VILAASVAAAAGPLASCSTAAVPYDSNVQGGIPKDEEVPTPAAGPGGLPAGILLADAGQVPVGGGRIFAADNVVVTQPTAGQFRAFSVVCTHVGCLCDKVAAGTIDCPCHGSTFSVADGAPVAGPATRPLAPVRIAIINGKIMLL